MDQHSSQPLTVAQAKANLRAAAQLASPTGWVQRRPWDALVVAAASGFISARTRIPIPYAILLGQRFVPMLLGRFLHSKSQRVNDRK